MRIAILGWGSLIWDRRDLPISGDWQRGGPVLPIEFSRISRSGERAGCLTLVIDEQHGASVRSRFAVSTRTNLDDAISDLRIREGTSGDRIGCVNLVRNTERPFARQQHPYACDTIKAWAQAHQWDAVVWTALPSNFEEVAQLPFSVEVAIQYLKALTEPAKSHALEYLRNARPEVVTPVRTAAVQAGLIPPLNDARLPIEEADLSLVDEVIGLTRRLCGLPHVDPTQLKGLERALAALERLPQTSEGADVEYTLGIRYGREDDYDEFHYTFRISDYSFCVGTMFVKQAPQGGHDHQTTILFEADCDGHRNLRSDDEEAGVDVLLEMQRAGELLNQNDPSEVLLFVADKSEPTRQQER